MSVNKARIASAIAGQTGLPRKRSSAATAALIETIMVYTDKIRKAVLQRSKIVHITPQSGDDAYPGYVVVGVKVVDTLPIQ